MAKKFFKEKVYSKRRTVLQIVIISICAVGIIAAFIIVTSLNETPKEFNAIIQDSVSIEINTKLPDKDVFFELLENVPEDEIEIDFKNTDIKKLGTYEVLITVYGEEYKSNLKVVDVTNPELALNEVNIKVGDEYTADDFVENCNDNSGETCSISFNKDSLDQDGNIIDFSFYTEPGTYEVVILATDSSNNKTTNKINLIITDETEVVIPPVEPSICKYGNMEYDSTYYIAYFVGNDGCALDLNLYQNEDIRKPAVELANKESEKLKLEFDEISGIEGNISIHRTINPILNNTGNGVVGYTLYIKASTDSGTIVSFHLKDDGTRVYDENPYSLK